MRNGISRRCTLTVLVSVTVSLALLVLYYVYDVDVLSTPRRMLLQRYRDQTDDLERAGGFRFEYTTRGLDARYPTPPGDMGQPVVANTSNPDVSELVDAGIRTQGFNQYASDLMSVRRRLPEIRDPWCRVPGRFIANLPQTSIVIVFYNEAWSVVLRTVHSVLDRSPAHLVKEIVLVDDSSTLPNLKAELDEYLQQYEKVRVIRAPARLGLIRARIFGAKNTTSEVITFLDAHVECTVGWLEALLDVVARNDTTIAIPTIDWIDEKNMALVSNKSLGYIGAYDWDLNFGWWGRWSMKKQYANKVEPFDTPAMAGGLFSIDRKFFERLGWYDEGFDIYGIENIELSMKSWMCGGKMVTVPCSRVAHIQKAGHPYLRNEKKDVVRANSIRLAEVWMDEYKQVIFDIHGIPHYLEEEFGPIAERKAVRERAGCRNFRYYIENAFPEMRSPYVAGAFRGEVHNVVLGNSYCLDFRREGNFFGMAPCDGKQKTQYWAHNYYQELNSYRYCIDYTGTTLAMIGCHRGRGNQAWRVQTDTGQLQSVKHDKCLALNPSSNVTLTMETCDPQRDSQRWTMSFIELDVTPFQKKP
ncbi:putative polypeptide N-acetylgalactosaminyltransferase 9 [Anopheles ziemanni]|uniref:putative polypeptide N-acetylgalactosaminyltransferase 9 n=1 Tax=Anopheles coustani TaxID=139045 RepID=UPI00265A48FE|nr:putative polypeptide N-acetylgalactosaminyltransferase 9 [Anopheles coustani]XP_058170625.1 putative polypeptide N-acetylgalactosaminyltransferase 9 [Anopheles ziemanni]